MGFLTNLLQSGKRAVSRYTGDKAFLHAATAAAANVIVADGQTDDIEIDSAIKGMMANAILKDSFSPAEIEEALNASLVNAKTRAGKAFNSRFIEAVMSRPIEQRQDIFLIAADVADNDGIADAEMRVLDAIGKALGGLDTKKLLS